MLYSIKRTDQRCAARTARPRRRMLCVVAVGTLISTLNQAYKSSGMHVSARMISGGRLLALTSPGIRTSVRSTCDAHSAPIRWKSRSLPREIPKCARDAHHRLDSRRPSIFIRYITRSRHEGKALSEITAQALEDARQDDRTFPRGTSIPRLPPDWSSLLVAFTGICTSGNARRTNKRTNRRMYETTDKRSKNRRERTPLSNALYFLSLFLYAFPLAKNPAREIPPRRYSTPPITIDGIRLVILSNDSSHPLDRLRVTTF